MPTVYYYEALLTSFSKYEADMTPRKFDGNAKTDDNRIEIDVLKHQSNPNILNIVSITLFLGK